ncbi:hypothetical protein [Sediminibacillus halophilus]|uniref:Lipoprotein n=1 Tax=Sediminibacillus halophilus TaxID=482461 RepID=A0A1G9W3U5_9BACI|nr:hypothetical protein [Sediminibacillus halophilus]SDM78867.1 hypothetical protein SAMN05216244_3408 [Sediminibacillus halophilus]
MNLKKLLFIIGLAIILFVTGCSNSETISISDKSKIVLIPDGEGGKALTFAVFIDNDTNKDSSPLYVEIEIQDEWLNSKVKKEKFIVGESIGIDKSVANFTIESNSEHQTGATLRVTGEIEENKLKQTIEQNDSVKVSILNGEDKVIQSGFIKNFGKDFTIDGIAILLIEYLKGVGLISQ